jgi:hypothetical protein
MIISRDGIFSYPTVVPERETFQRPIEYPANLTTGGTFNYRRETTPGWSLQNAPNQILP